MSLVALTQPDIGYPTADVPTLIGIWERAYGDLLDAAEAGGPEGWNAASPCPGWDVGDLVAHVTAIERFLLGRADAPHEPDFERLPHAAGGLSRIIEVPVDLRRSWQRAEVLAEARETLAARAADLRGGPLDATTERMGPFGRPMAVPDLLRMRTLDIWIHEQDVRTALGTPGDLGTPPAWVTAGRLSGALGKVWVKAVGAPAGAVAEVVVTGPGVALRVQVAHDPPGRGTTIVPVPDPDVSLELSWPDLVTLGAGRIGASEAAERVARRGDPDLAEALVTHLAITP